MLSSLFNDIRIYYGNRLVKRNADAMVKSAPI